MNLSEDPSNEPRKLKEVSKRAGQLGFIVMFLSLGITAYFYFLGLYISSAMIGVLTFGVGLIIFLQYIKLIKEIQYAVVCLVSATLIFSSFIEGAQTGQYFYFFPLIIVIPVIVDYKKSSVKELAGYFTSVLISFIVCFYVGHTRQPIEHIPPDVAQKMLFENAGSAMALTLAFAIAYIYYERNYLNAIMKEKNPAISARTKFLSTMGHELRTPLNGIIGALSILKDESPEMKTNEYFQILKYCSNHMHQLVNDILDFNKIEAGKLEINPIEVNLKQLLLNSTLPFYNQIEEKSLKLKVNIDPKLDITVLIDDVRLIQILNNLLSNALKFTERGYIQIDVECRSIDKLTADVSFTVKDTGMGIEKDNQERIFESFWQVYDESTRKHTGTGLGLTICIRLLKLMNSSLSLVSEKGKGSTFSFNLVLKRAANIVKNVEHPVNDNEDLRGLRILIVEDNQINMIIARKILTGFHAECSAAYNGREALDMLAKDSAYDMVIMDLEMPVMDGFTAIIALKKVYPDLPVLAFTASLIDQQMLAELIASGFADCVSKPFQPHQLVSQIKKYTHQLQPVDH
jgi:signal transduction histidine kinase/CheY-like chemotaxis protein